MDEKIEIDIDEKIDKEIDMDEKIRQEIRKLIKQ